MLDPHIGEPIPWDQGYCGSTHQTRRISYICITVSIMCFTNLYRNIVKGKTLISSIIQYPLIDLCSSYFPKGKGTQRPDISGVGHTGKIRYVAPDISGVSKSRVKVTGNKQLFRPHVLGTHWASVLERNRSFAGYLLYLCFSNMCTSNENDSRLMTFRWCPTDNVKLLIQVR